MNHPYGPYGQGLPGQQPGYPQPHSYQQPPQQPGYPGYGPPPTPSGATAITAGVLAGLGALANVIAGAIAGFALLALTALAADSSYDNTPPPGGEYALFVVLVLITLGCGLLLATGAVLLLQRKMIGRWLVAAGCGIVILQGLGGLAIASSFAARYDYDPGMGFTVVHLIFAITTLVLVLVPSTTRWIQAKQQPSAPPYFPPYPG